MHDLSDTFNLVHRAQAGETGALSRLFDRYYERVRRVVRVRLGPKLRAHCESGDALQATFLKAFQLFDRFEMREEGSLIKWLAAIAETQIRDALDRESAKKRGRDQHVPLGGVATTDATRVAAFDWPATTRADPEAAAREAEEHDRLERALDRMPAPARELILARDFAGMSWDRVAFELEIPSGDAARMRYASAMRDLAVLLAGESGATT